MPAPKSKSNPSGKGQSITVSFHDSIALVKNQIRWTPKGVTLLTKWHFDEGAEVEFGFEHNGEKHLCSGIVVACHPLRNPTGHFSTVLFFVEAPGAKLHQAACDCRLQEDEKRRSRGRAAVKTRRSSVPQMLD
jgi:hypothetical protein